MTDLMCFPNLAKHTQTLLIGAVFVWEGFGSEGAARAAWGARGIQARYHRQAVIVPAGPQLGCSVLQRLRKTTWLSLLGDAEQANTT